MKSDWCVRCFRTCSSVSLLTQEDKSLKIGGKNFQRGANRRKSLREGEKKNISVASRRGERFLSISTKYSGRGTWANSHQTGEGGES